MSLLQNDRSHTIGGVFKKREMSTRLPDPVSRARDTTSVAAQYARAKALKEQQERALKERLEKAESGAEAGQRRLKGVFGRATAWGMGFWVWLL